MNKVVMTFLIYLMALNAYAGVSTNRNYQDVTAYIENLEKLYPQNANIFTLGHTNQGVAIKGIKLGQGETHHLVVGAHHGNEYGSTELALNFAESIAKQPIEGQTIYVIPVLNIDGFNSRDRWERVNGRSIDLNRDYPGPCISEDPFNSRSTAALAEFVAKENIIASATLHTYWPTVVYPWGLSSRDTDTLYTPIFLKMAQNATAWSQYEIGNATEIIYPADGTYEDYIFWKHGAWSLLFEVGRNHFPNNQALQEMVNQNVPGLRKMFEEAPKERAQQHEFTGKCDDSLRILDLHIE